jgi:prolyl oligopeptidase
MRMWTALVGLVRPGVVEIPMHRNTILFALFLGVGCERPPSKAPLEGGVPPRSALVYPPAPHSSVVEERHGVQVVDPFRPLEDLNSKETTAWIAAENRLSDAYFATNSSLPSLRTRLGQLSSSDNYGLPRRRGARYFWTHNNGKQDQDSLFTAHRLDEVPTLLLDPNSLSPDGALAFIGYAVSNDGNHVAYGLSIGGGDWVKFRIRSVEATSKSRTETPEELEHIKYYPPAFSPDGNGLYYSRFPAPAAGKEISETDHDCRLYFHALGTPTSQDVVVYARPDHPSWQFRPTVTRDGHYLVMEIGDGEVGDRNQELLVYFDLRKPGSKPVTLVDKFEAEYIFLGNEGPVFFLETTLDAPKKRIIAVDTRSPRRNAWRTIVPAGDEAIEVASLVGHQLIVKTLRDAHTAATAYDLNGQKLREIPLPGIGSAWGFAGGSEATTTFYMFSSFTVPWSIYEYDLKSGLSTLWKTSSIPFDASRFETVQFFYPSKDGTKVPLFLTSKKGVTRDGRNPTLLTAYGGGGWSWTPSFDPTSVPWLERGGVTVVANIRGGGEYGEAWHQAAVRTKHQVALDDFIAAAEWLIATKVTSSERLGIHGRSGGGLLVGAVLVQRPELFGAAAPFAGVFDMLRFPLFGQGGGWETEYGSPDNPSEFEALYRYSPLHNVRAGTHYPPTFIVTADHDVRVAPLHSYKFAATLQAAQGGPAPILLRVETQSGHGGGTTRSSRIEQDAEMLGFFEKSLGVATTSP